MSKEPVNLSLRDMYAIKHALQNRVQGKKTVLPLARAFDKNKVEQLEKDIIHEGALAVRMETEIKKFREKYGIR